MEILKQIWKKRNVVIISTIVACLIGSIFSLIIKPSYKATVELAMQPRDAISGFSQDTQAVKEYFKHQVEILKSGEVVDDAIDKLHLKLSDVLNQRQPRESFLKYIKITQVGNSLVKITATTDTPQLAIGMASQLANSFLRLNKETSFSISKAAMDWLSESSKFGKDLKGTENKLLNFIKENNMQNPQQQFEYYQENADRLIKEKAQFLNALKENEQILEKLQAVTAQKNTAAVITQYLNDPYSMELLGSYKKEYTDIQTEIDDLLKTYKVDHPKIVQLNQQKDSIVKTADSKIQEALKEIKSKIEYSKSKIKDVEAEMEKEKKEYSNLLDKKKEFDILKIKLDGLTKLYDKAKQELEASNISVISISIIGFKGEGSVPVIKSKPVKMLLIIFTVAGFIIGLLMALFLTHSSVEKKVPEAGRDG